MSCSWPRSWLPRSVYEGEADTMLRIPAFAIIIVGAYYVVTFVNQAFAGITAALQ